MTIAALQSAGCRPVGGALLRALAVAVIAAVVAMPPLARAHDRLHRAPADAYSRFRWANSCESVPQKIASATPAAVFESDAPPIVPAPPPSWPRVASDVTTAHTDPASASPRLLRAPPAAA